MWDNIKDFFAKIFDSRIFFLYVAFGVMSIVLFVRLFSLQIVGGKQAQENYCLMVIKNKTINSTRGNIYDRDGNLLAYNQLANAITIQDNGLYSTIKEKNQKINAVIADVLACLDKNGDEFFNDFQIDINERDELDFNISGTRLKRFLADIYGESSIDNLGYNSELGYSTANASAEEVMNYLYKNRFGISDEYSALDKYRIAIVRYNLSKNTYQKYISSTIASDVSDETVAYVSEHKDTLQGVEVSEDTIRKYDASKYFAHIIGYTGKIDEEEYNTLSEISDEYSLTDIIGKSGIEQYMDTELKGKKGFEKLYVDNMGRELESIERIEPTVGNDVYLSLKLDLQQAVYNLLEQQIAGVVYSKIINEKSYNSTSSADIRIPIDDVYYALINNNIISTRHFSSDDASETERRVKDRFESRQADVLSTIKNQLITTNPIKFENLEEEMQVYENYIQTMLLDNKIIDTSAIDWTDPKYVAWKNDEISLQEYLRYVISKGWFDITQLPAATEYADSDELYDLLVEYIMTDIQDDIGFSKKIYRYMIADNQITGKDICLILFDQMLIDYDDEAIAKIKSGEIAPFDYMMKLIRYLQLTPAQLALDPCTGSCVIADVKTGELLACVTYPGYDNNKLANKVDSAYFNTLLTDLSSPFYNNATQQKTAPGSTFKMITATAALTERVITTETKIEDKGVFDTVTDGPKCWYYPGSHGYINVSEALRDSCNYFFYESAWLLSQKNGAYSEATGIDKLTKYASMYGLDENTGIEISESVPEIATEYPITAGIGQSDNNFTTIALSRYVTAVANRGKVYNYTLLSKLTDSLGNVLENYSPSIKNTMSSISDSTWDAIQYGNMLVCENNSAFDDFPDNFRAAGKTGTAQQIATRPNHALFVGYAPYENPEISIATRIAYGYTSKNAASVSAEILKYYFNLESDADILNGQAANVDNTGNSFND